MQVILLEKIKHLGSLGSTVKVKPGYARNFLIPHKKAIQATTANIAKFESQRAELEKAEAAVLAAAQKRADALKDVVIEIGAKVGDEGKLFGSVGTRDIVDAIKQKGVEVTRNEILLPEGTLRQVGEHEVSIQVHTDIRVSVKVVIVAE